MSDENNLDILDQTTLGESAGEVQLHGREEMAWAALRLTQQAQRTLDIFTHDLDAPLYDRLDFLDALRQFAIRSKNSRVRILLQELETPQRSDHRLILLYRRLPSRFEVRHCHPDHAEHPENFLLADRMGYLHRRFFEEYAGTLDFAGKRRADLLGRFFDEVWDKSEADYILRGI
jgi:phosphatidylserine/phosphatidylglycerophosphate/cardiolipin synthase-like enzyme